VPDESQKEVVYIENEGSDSERGTGHEFFNSLGELLLLDVP